MLIGCVTPRRASSRRLDARRGELDTGKHEHGGLADARAQGVFFVRLLWAIIRLAEGFECSYEVEVGDISKKRKRPTDEEFVAEMRQRHGDCVYDSEDDDVPEPPTMYATGVSARVERWYFRDARQRSYFPGVRRGRSSIGPTPRTSPSGDFEELIDLANLRKQARVYPL